jgi:nitrogen fixation/metabolism regulation signal transduction histidine kinase
MRIRTKYLVILIALVATVTAAVSIFQFTATQRLTNEYQNRSLQRFEAALTDAARNNAIALSTLTAESLLEPLFFQNIDGVGNIVAPLAARPDIIALNIYTRDGQVFHNGSDELETFGDKAPREVLDILETKSTQVSVGDEMTIRIMTPIIADGYVFGALDLLIDTTFVEDEISAMQRDFIAASDAEIQQQIGQLSAVSLIALLIAGGVATILASRLSAPIQQLATATRRIAGGHFSVAVDNHRHDELGALAASFDDMSRALRDTMVSRSELQDTVEAQIRELRQTHEKLVALETDRREVLDEIGEDL